MNGTSFTLPTTGATCTAESLSIEILPGLLLAGSNDLEIEAGMEPGNFDDFNIRNLRMAGACLPLVDADSDGVFDCDDNCPNHANNNQADGDKNGIGDACDVVQVPGVGNVALFILLSLLMIALAISAPILRMGKCLIAGGAHPTR